MTDFVFISANDIHISDKPPRSRTDDFKTVILGKISQMRMACEKLKVDAALIAGDLFNLKDPARNSHNLNQELIREFRKFPCPIYMIVGNHDMTGNNIESLKSQPLGVLFEDRTIIPLTEEKVTKNGVSVSLVGIHYTEEDITLKKLPPRGNSVAQICLLHVYASIGKGGKLFDERLYGYDELAQMGPDVFIIGHYHLDQGIYRQDGKHFINLGAVTRGVLSEDNILHQPKIGLTKVTVDDSGKVAVNTTAIKLRVQPAEDIFDIEKKKEEEKESKEIQEFIQKLATEVVNKNKDTAATIDGMVQGMDMAVAVKNRVMGFIQKAASMRQIPRT